MRANDQLLDSESIAGWHAVEIAHLGCGLLLILPVLLDIGWMAVAAVVVLALVLALLVAWLVRLIFAGQRRQPWLVSYSRPCWERRLSSA